MENSPPAMKDSRRPLVARVLPWLVALGILAVLVARISPEQLRDGLAQSAALPLAGYVVIVVAITLVLDGWASQSALKVVGVERPLREVVLVRGATYLLGLINYAVGQGGLGFYLHRLGHSARRAAAVVLFLLVLNVWALVILASLAAVVAGGDTPVGRWLGFLGLASFPLYIGASRVLESGLRRVPLLEGLLDAGARGHVIALGPRLVHVGVFSAALWGGLWIWGIRVPLFWGLAGMTIVLFAAALPITPAGLGTTQASLVALFSSFAPGELASDREAAVLSFGLLWAAWGALAQAGWGSLSWFMVRRLDSDDRLFE